MTDQEKKFDVAVFFTQEEWASFKTDEDKIQATLKKISQQTDDDLRWASLPDKWKTKLDLPTEDDVYRSSLFTRANNMAEKLDRTNDEIAKLAWELELKTKDAMRIKMELNVLSKELGDELVNEVDDQYMTKPVRDTTLGAKIDKASKRLEITGPRITKAYAQLDAVFDIDNKRTNPESQVEHKAVERRIALLKEIGESVIGGEPPVTTQSGTKIIGTLKPGYTYKEFVTFPKSFSPDKMPYINLSHTHGEPVSLVIVNRSNKGFTYMLTNNDKSKKVGPIRILWTAQVEQ